MAKIKNNSRKANLTRNRVRKYRRRVRNRKIYEEKIQKHIKENCEEVLNDDNIPENEPLKNTEIGIEDKLRDWAIKHRITKWAINDLLGILIFFGFTYLPKDSRTLMKTPTDIVINTLTNGKMWYHGIQKTLSKIFEKCSKELVIRLDFNFDGMPLFDSSTTQFWPIIYSIRGMFSILFHANSFTHWVFCMKMNVSSQKILFFSLEFPNMPPIVAGIWCGNGKPPLNEYLTPLISELKELLMNGITINNHSIGIRFGWCICDTPARSFLKGIALYTT